MIFDGTGTRSSPIFIQDSEEEIIQELTPQQFYGSSTGKYDTIQSNQTVSMVGKRKSREEEELAVDGGNINPPPSTSLENRISQPESKKARKRRRKAERDALERNKLRGIDWLDYPSSYPPTAGPSQPVPPLQARLNAERQHSEFLEDMLRVESQAAMVFHDYGPPSRTPLSSTFDSDWVSSMVIAGEFPRCKKVKTSISSKISPHSTPKPLPAFPSSLAPSEVLPPIHIHHDLAVSTEAPAPTHSPQQALPQTIGIGAQQALPQTIGMKPEQDPNSRHGIFHITELTTEAGSGMKKRKHPYIPNPARTLVMEQLPKTHRTIDFVGNWCRSASGVPAHHLFVDPPSATALIEFHTADLARKAWASPRLGQDLLGKKSNLLKGKPREDLIKVWWYRVDGVGAGAGVGEIEEGEIEEDENQVDPVPPSSPHKESKKDRKARLAKERETKKMATMKENQQQQHKQKQKNVEHSSSSTPTLSVSTPPPFQFTSSQVNMLSPAPEVIPLPAVIPFDPIIGSLCPPAQPGPCPLTQLALPTNLYFSIPSPCSTTPMTAVGSSLAPGARGGHDDSASIASSAGRSSPDRHLSRQTAIVASLSSKVVVATTVGQADDLADYSEVDMDVDSNPPPGEVVSRSAPPPTWEKATSANVIQHPAHPTATNNIFPLRPSIPAIITRNLGDEARSKPQSQAQSHLAYTSLATTHRPVVAPFIFKNRPSDPQQSSPVSSLSATLTPTSHISVSSKSLPSRPIQAPHTSHALPLHPKSAASVRSRLDNQIPKVVGARNPTPPGVPPQSPVSIVPASVAPSSSNSESAGQVMEENLRQLVFASKRARASGVHPHASSSQPGSSTAVDVNITSPVHNFTAKVLSTTDGPNHAQARESNQVVDSTLAPSPSLTTIPPTLNQPTTDTFSFEDLAVTFITQTIENAKANNNQPQPHHRSMDSSLGSTVISASPSPPTTLAPNGVGSQSILPFTSASSNAPAGGVVPTKLPLATNTSANLTRSELSAKQRRLEKHLQESKSLIERISTAKTKREKELLLKIMTEKMRLFEEENKASETRINSGSNHATSNKKATNSKTHTKTVLQFQQWPTTQSNSILVLSDDED